MAEIKYGRLVHESHFIHKGVNVHQLVIKRFDGPKDRLIWVRENFDYYEFEGKPNPLVHKDFTEVAGDPMTKELALDCVREAFDKYWGL